MRLFSLLLLVTLAALPRLAHGDRVKELVRIEGIRENHLVGYGLVVGLQGTGDDASSPVVRRSLATLIKNLGVNIDPNEIKAKNVAAVLVTAKLPAFGRSGTPIDVLVSSAGTAKSLSGGTLVATPLKGADLRVYAIAQGALSVGGFAESGATGSSAKKNHVTVARIPSGALIERDAPGAMPGKRVVLQLREPDATTAVRIAEGINKALNPPPPPAAPAAPADPKAAPADPKAAPADPKAAPADAKAAPPAPPAPKEYAKVADPGTVVIEVGADWAAKVPALIAVVEAVEVIPDVPARVVIDERTGAIVVGTGVSLRAAAVAYGALTVEVSEELIPSQPNILSKQGETVVTPKSGVKVNEAGGPLQTLKDASTVGDVAAALNLLGAKPRDLVSILQALKAAGALRAEIEVI